MMARDGQPSKDQGWRLVPYVMPSGCCPVREFLDGLQADNYKEFTQFQQVLRPMFENRGPMAVGPPYWTGLSDGLYEMRFGKSRIYCSVETGRRVWMYLGLRKFWEKFRNSDRDLCNARRTDALSTDYDDEQRELLYRAYCQRR